MKIDNNALLVSRAIMEVVNGTWLPGGAVQVEAMIQEIIADALSERAVSPAESVQSVDTPEFRELLKAYALAYQNDGISDQESIETYREAEMLVIAHIDASRAAARGEGVKQERKEADDCARYQAAQIVELRKKVEEAHAEGRRSAMEELEAKIEAAARDKDGNHVDDLRGWLDEAREENEVQGVAFHACSLKLKQAEEELAKEKERADRAEHNLKQVNLAYQFERQRAETAEAALTANRAGREYVALSDKELSDPEYMRAYVEGCQESFADLLAARQAPDLDSLQRYVATPHDKRGMREEKLGAWVLLSDVQALLSSTAQPSQQFAIEEVEHICDAYESGLGHGLQRDGHNDGTIFENPDLGAAYVYGYREGESRAQQPLQQEGGKDLISVLREYLLREMPSGTVIGDPTWWAPRIAKAIAAPQPSDNLQQASTSQAGPAICHKDAGLCGAGGYCDDCHLGKEAASTAQEEPAKHCKFCGGMGCEACSYQEAASSTDADLYTATAADWCEDFAHEYGRDMNGDESVFLVPPKASASAAQATPEYGRDELTKFETWAKARGWDVRRYPETTDTLVYISSWTQGGWTVWRALAAQQKPPPEGADLPKAAQAVLDHFDTAKREFWERFPSTFDVLAQGKLNTLRAALVAGHLSAKPVAWLLGYTDDACVVTGDPKEVEEWVMRHEEIYKPVPLYRAAPPQQVDTNGLLG